MSRVLKFRCWNKEKGIMVYADEDDSSCYWDGVHSSTVELINTYLGNVFGEPYIWMQFTGLLDKNGKEIYESDVLGGGEIVPGKVVFFDGSWRVCQGHENTTDSVLSIWRTSRLEVIGNIHQHPERLNETKS